MFVANELLAVQVRDGSIEVRPRLVALDVQESKAHFSDGTSVQVRLLDTVTAYKLLYECISRGSCTIRQHVAAKRHQLLPHAVIQTLKYRSSNMQFFATRML